MKKLIVLLLIAFSIHYGQKRETRAVWVATNFRLDWPPPVYDEIEQKIALDEIFKTIKEKNFNTVYFQVVIKGTALYDSKILPFCPYISGFGETEHTYDPLAYAVSLAKIYGLEIHAWINTARVFSGNEYEFLQLKKHITQTHNDWIVTSGKGSDTSYWLDFGIPEAREFMISVAKEIAENYDVDGIQFDFLRYPGRNFSDEKSFAEYGDTLSLFDWRRKNINSFIHNVYDTLKAVRKTIKVGVAPFGIYKNIDGAKGGESYSYVFQDSRKWLQNGWVDYVVPQIYWNINDNPRFDSLAYDWGRNSFERNVVLGVAAYKSDVKNEIKEIIETSRKSGSKGVAMFRYSFIKDKNFNPFEKFVFPAEMPWIDSSKPLPPTNFVATADGEFIHFSWHKSLSKVKYYSLYDVTFEPNIIALFPSDAVSTRMKILQPKAIVNKFLLRSVNELWNESKPTKAVSIGISKLMNLFDSKDLIPTKPFIFSSNGNNFLVIFNDKKSDEIINVNYGNASETLDLKRGINLIKLHANNFNSIEIYFPSSGEKIKLSRKFE